MPEFGLQTILVRPALSANAVEEIPVAEEVGADVRRERATATDLCQPFKCDFPLCYFLNQGVDEGKRVECEFGFLREDIPVHRIPRLLGAVTGNGLDNERAEAIAHALALRRASAENRSVILFDDNVLVTSSLRAELEDLELPEDWGVLILEGGRREAGWGRVTKVETHPLAYSVSGRFVREVAGSLRRAGNIPEGLGVVSKKIPTYRVGLRSLGRSGSQPVDLMKWYRGYLDCKRNGMPVTSLPPLEMRRQLLHRFGVDIFQNLRRE